jgi:phytoene synthase
MTMVHGRTFYFASQVLPTAKKRAIHSAYAFCRVADDLVDREPVLGTDCVMTRLAAWENQLEHPVDPIAVAYACIRERYRIPIEPNRDLFTGVRMDLTQHEYATWDDLSEYCYCVAGTVGLITAPILGARAQDTLSHAVELGIAMQLTNILRDVAEDARLGRIYLPLEDLAAFGVERDSIFAGAPTGDFASLMRFEIERARSFYESARHGYAALDLVGQFATLTSGHLYGKILNQIEALDYDVFSERAHVSTLAKVREVPYIVRSLAGIQLNARRESARHRRPTQ